MIYNVFDTENEAINAQANDFAVFISSKSGDDYLSNTTSWDEVKQRNDGKFIYMKCPDCPDGQYTEEEFSEDWFDVD